MVTQILSDCNQGYTVTIHNQAAPGDLEEVRRFINTWSIPNQTRIATDLLPPLVCDPMAWERELSMFPLQSRDSLETLLALRTDLRRTCADHSADRDALNPWFERTPLIALVRSTNGSTAIELKPSQNTYMAYILAIVANAISCGHWSRLKACGDCKWTFYDHTRSANKRWCGMSKGGPQGRACGTIAKVRAFREREVRKVR
jgi:hypothetical protein